MYRESIEAGLTSDHPAVYSIGLLETLATCSGPASARIALLIDADNEAELPCFKCAAESCWRFDRLVAGERLPPHSPMIRRRLCGGPAISEA